MERKTCDPEVLPDWLLQKAGADYSGYEPSVLTQRLLNHLGITAPGDLEAAGVGTEQLQLALATVEPHLFADPGFWRALRDVAVPRLRTYPSVLAWIPGCGTGLTAAALAIVLEEEGLLERARVFATDVAEAPLAHARTGRLAYGIAGAAETAYRAAGGRKELSAHLTPDGLLANRLLARLYFVQHSLATDASFNEFQLIISRGLLCSQQFSLRHRTRELFRASLCRGGYLALGFGDTPDLAKAIDLTPATNGLPFLLRKDGIS